MSNPSIPHQLKLFPRTERSRPTVAARVEFYADRNRECAAIILRTPERYGGVGSLMVIWARAVLNGAECERPAERLAA